MKVLKGRVEITAVERLGRVAPDLMMSVTSSSAVEFGVTRAKHIEQSLRNPTRQDTAFLAELLKRAAAYREGPR